MPDFDAEFVDVTRAGVSATDTLTSVATANANATALQGAIDLLHMRGGGFLHFPPGRHYIGRRPAGSSIGDPAASTENGDIVVYDDVTLWFSPGAVLVPLRVGVAAPHFEIREVGDPHGEDTMVRIEIHGAIRARRSMIFETSIEANSVANDAGLILLVGTKIDEVYPEWWGAFSNAADPPYATRSRHGIQAAFDAAHRHRLRVRRDPTTGMPSPAAPLRQMSSIPIVMKGMYFIDGGLTIGARAEEVRDGIIQPMSAVRPINTAAFVLRGDRAVTVGDQATLNAHSDRPIDESMLTIRGPSGFTVKDLSFNGAFVAARCLEVTAGNGRDGASSFENSGFFRGRRELIRIDASVVGEKSLSPEPLAFKRCRLVTSSEKEAADRGLVHIDPGGQLVGVDLDARDRILVEFHSCFMSGPANPFVIARSGWFNLQECTMHVVRLWDTRPVKTINSEPNSNNGTDVFIAPPTVRYEGGLAPTAGIERWLVEAASFTAKEFESQSWQVISSHENTVANAASTSTVIMNFNMNIQSNSPSFQGGPVPPTHSRHHTEQELFWNDAKWMQLHSPPSIYWGGPRSSRSDLLLMGGVTQAWNRSILSGAFESRVGQPDVSVQITRDQGPRAGCVHVVNVGTEANLGRVFELGAIVRTGSWNPDRDPKSQIFGTGGSMSLTLQVLRPPVR